MKPRGLIVIHQFRPVTGGAELQAERLAAKLVQLGHPMQVLTQFRSPESLPEEILQGARVHRVTFPLAYRLDSSLIPTFQYLMKNRHTYDVLHVQQAFGHAIVAVVAARCLGKQCIIKLACAGPYGDLSVLSSFERSEWGIRILRHAHRVIAISSQMEKELISWRFPPKRIQRISNGVDTTYFQRSKTQPNGNRMHFILIGRRHPQKGIDTALQAVKLLRERGLCCRFELKMYGRDFEEYDYRRMAAELEVTESVEFLPHTDDMRQVYEAAHALILPSRGEGMSNSLLEAMSMQLAIIATPVSGTLDVVENGRDGLLIPPDSPVQLADSMTSIILDADLRQKLGQGARQKVARKFSLDQVAEQYSRLYLTLRRSPGRGTSPTAGAEQVQD